MAIPQSGVPYFDVCAKGRASFCIASLGGTCVRFWGAPCFVKLSGTCFACLVIMGIALLFDCVGRGCYDEILCKVDVETKKEEGGGFGLR